MALEDEHAQFVRASATKEVWLLYCAVSFFWWKGPPIERTLVAGLGGQNPEGKEKRLGSVWGILDQLPQVLLGV